MLAVVLVAFWIGAGVQELWPRHGDGALWPLVLDIALVVVGLGLVYRKWMKKP